MGLGKARAKPPRDRDPALVRIELRVGAAQRDRMDEALKQTGGRVVLVRSQYIGAVGAWCYVLESVQFKRLHDGHVIRWEFVADDAGGPAIRLLGIDDAAKPMAV